MEEKREPESFMMRVARFIVNKRKAFIALFILACIYSVLSMSKVKVINDLTDYLPESTETRQGLDIMDEQFTTFGSAKIMVTNITYEKALQLAKEMEDINGISAVDFYDASDDDYDDKEVTDYYQDASALYTLTFDEPEDTRLSQTAMEKVRDSLDGYSSYVYTTVDKDDAKSLQEDMKLIGVIVVFIVLGVLLFTSRTYAEIAILPIIFLVSMLLNIGTNYWFGSVSFVTNAVGAVLQLAMSVDYAIIFLHRFLEETLTEPEVLKKRKEYLRFGDQLYLLPPQMVSLKGLKVLRPGLHIGTIKKNRFEPSHALALWLFPEDAKVQKEVEPDGTEAVKYLKGETLTGDTGMSAPCEKGWVLICTGNVSLGWGKMAAGTIKNHYPKGLRWM